MLNPLDDRAEAQWTTVSSLTAAAAQRRACDRLVARLRRRISRVRSNPILTPQNGDAPCTHC